MAFCKGFKADEYAKSCLQFYFEKFFDVIDEKAERQFLQTNMEINVPMAQLQEIVVQRQVLKRLLERMVDELSARDIARSITAANVRLTQNQRRE